MAVDNARMIAYAMDICEEKKEVGRMGDETNPSQGNQEEKHVELEDVQQVGDKRFFVKKAWREILLSVYTMLRTLLQLFLDISLCVDYYNDGDYAWFALTTGIFVSSHIVCFVWMLSIQYGSNRFKDIRVLIDEGQRSPLGIMDGVTKQVKDYFQCGSNEGAVKTTYHVLPNYRVFYFEDHPGKVYNINLPKPPAVMSLKFSGWCLPFLAIIAQLPTHLEYEYLKWRRMALVSLRHDGKKYHEKMVKCVFVKNILQMVLIIGFGERAFQLFLQLYIVTQANHISPLQLTQMCVGFFGMLFSSVYVQTICSFMNRNLWENGLKAYIGGLMVYVSMMLLALTSLIVIFIYAAIYHQVLAFIAFAIFLIFLLSHFTRGILISFRPVIVPVAKFLFWVLFAIFIFSDYHWHKCLIRFNDFSGIESGSVNTSVMICEGARILACNLTFDSVSVSSFSDPFICISVYYDNLYFIFNIVPYIILLFAFMSPLYKGFEYYYDYKPKVLPGETNESSSTDEMAYYYKQLERKLASANCPAVIISVVKIGETTLDSTSPLV